MVVPCTSLDAIAAFKGSSLEKDLFELLKILNPSFSYEFLPEEIF